MRPFLSLRLRALPVCLLLGAASFAGCARWSHPDLSESRLEDPGRTLAVMSAAPPPPRAEALQALDRIHAAALRGLRAAASRRGRGGPLLVPAGGGTRLSLDLSSSMQRPPMAAEAGMESMEGMQDGSERETLAARTAPAPDAEHAELAGSPAGESAEGAGLSCRRPFERVAAPGDSWWAWSVETGLGYEELARLNGRSLALVRSGELGAGDVVVLLEPGSGPPCGGAARAATPKPPGPKPPPV